MDFSVVIPVYKYRRSMEHLIRDLHLILQNYSWEIVVVIDTMDEDVFQSVYQLRNQWKQLSIRIVRLRDTFGQHRALCCGFEHTTGKWIVCLDDDYKFTFDSMKTFFETVPSKEPFDLIYGQVSSGKIDNQLKIYFFKFVRMFSLLPNPVPKQSGSSLKAYSVEIVNQILSKNTAFMFLDAFHLYFVKDIKYVPVAEKERETELSNYSGIEKLSFVFHVMRRYTRIPEFSLGVAFVVFNIIIWSVMGVSLIIFTIEFIALLLIFFGLARSRRFINESYSSYINEVI